MSETEKGCYEKVLHGFIVHERSRQAYSTLLLTAKALVLSGALVGIALLWLAPSMPAFSLALGGAGVAIALAALVQATGLGWAENRFGKRPSPFIDGSGVKSCRIARL